MLLKEKILDIISSINPMNKQMSKRVILLKTFIQDFEQDP